MIKEDCGHLQSNLQCIYGRQKIISEDTKIGTRIVQIITECSGCEKYVKQNEMTEEMKAFDIEYWEEQRRLIKKAIERYIGKE